MTIINTNVNAMIGLNNLRMTNDGLSKSLERLSSGLRINVGADDPSGLAIAMGMEAQIGGIRTVVQNAEDGISMIHTADGALSESHDILMRMRDLTLRAANEAVMTTGDQDKLSSEFKNLKIELARKSQAVTFNSKNLFAGSYGSAGLTNQWVMTTNGVSLVWNQHVGSHTYKTSVVNPFGTRVSGGGGGQLLQVGPDNGAFTKITMLIGTMTLTGLGLTHFFNSGAASALYLTPGVSLYLSFNDLANQHTAYFGGFGSAMSTVGTSVRMNASFALKYLKAVDYAIDKVSDARAALGIQERRIMSVIDDLKSEEINVSAAKSRIYDADMAAEISEFTRLQILQQSGTAILAQANAQPQTILQLMT